MVKFGKHVAIIPICLGSLAACAGVSEVVASPPSVASATIFFAPPALQTNRGARSELLRVGKRDAVREAYHSCEHTGGDWKLPTIGSRVKGTVQYGANDCKKGARISLTSYAVGPEGDCGPELGYTNSGAEIEFDAAGTLIFSGTAGAFTVVSTYFNAETAYTFFLVDALDGQTIFQTYIGPPQSGQLTFASPFANGLQWPNGDPLAGLLCSQ